MLATSSTTQSEVYYTINNNTAEKHSLKQREISETGFWGQKKANVFVCQVDTKYGVSWLVLSTRHSVLWEEGLHWGTSKCRLACGQSVVATLLLINAGGTIPWTHSIKHESRQASQVVSDPSRLCFKFLPWVSPWPSSMMKYNLECKPHKAHPP